MEQTESVTDTDRAVVPGLGWPELPSQGPSAPLGWVPVQPVPRETPDE